MAVSNQIKAICWRNYILKKRGWKSSLFDLGFLFLIFFITFLLNLTDNLGTEPELKPTVIYQKSTLKKDCLNYMSYSDVSVLFTKKDDVNVQKIMDHLKRSNTEPGHYHYFKVFGFDNEDNLEDWVIENYNESDYRQIVFGIVFDDVNENEFSYKLRATLPEMSSSYKPIESDVKTLPDMYEPNCLLELQKYLTDGFMISQQKTVPNIDYGIQKFPIPEHMEPGGLWLILGLLLTGIMFVSVVITTILPISKIVSEKETGAKELMRLMGMRRGMIWTGWLMNMLTFGLVNMTYAIVFLKVSFKENVSPLLPNSNILILWITFVLFLVSMSFYSLFFCSVLKRPLLTTFVALVGHVLPLITYSEKVNDLGLFLNILLYILCPQLNWVKTTKLIIYFEKQNQGIGFLNLFEVPYDQDGVKIRMIWLLIAFLLCCLFYTLLIWYFDNVMPGEYGIARPLHFPLQALRGKNNDIFKEDEYIVDENFFEKVSPNTKVGLSVRNLFKVFGHKVRAVNGVNLDVYDGQITALLGHNGAGKTTTMSIITGMYSPSSGRVYAISNDGTTYNIFDDMETFRQDLGLCPQHNLVMSYLTVLEHLTFFGMLKGLTKEQAKSDGINLLRRLDLLDKSHVFPKNLSGGMKRKLCLAISLMGQPKIIILDEPTSGLDPESRRELWDTLLNLRQQHTILITTHFMEEADALGDQIAIMDHGKIICCGSPMFLKKKYGTGYNFQLLTNPGADTNDITNLIKRVIPGSALKTVQRGQLTYSLPIEQSHLFASLFEELESKKGSLGITNIGISLTTMEEVFLRAGVDSSQLVKNDGSDETDGASNGKTIRRSSSTECSRSIYNYRPDTVLSQKKLTGLSLARQHFQLLFMKKLLCYKRSLLNNLIYVIIVLACFTVAGWRLSDFETSASISTRTISLNLNDMYSDSKVVVTYNEIDKKYAELYNSLIPKTMYRIYKSNVDIIQTLLEEAKNINEYKRDYVVASSWGSEPSATALYSTFSNHGSAISMNMLLNAIVQSSGLNTKLSLSYQALPRKGSQEKSMCNLEYTILTAFFIMFLLTIGLLFFMGNLALFPLKERLNDAKQIQLMTGLSPITYWLAIFTWDLFIYSVVVILSLGILAIFDLQFGFVTNLHSLGVLVLLLLLFGLSSIAFTYLFSFLLKSSAAVSRFLLFNLYIGIAGAAMMIIITFINIPFLSGLCMEIVNAGLYLVPTFCFAISMIKFFITSFNYVACPHCRKVCNDPLQYFGWDKTQLSKEMLFFAISFCLYVTLIATIEYHLWGKLHAYVTGIIYGKKMDISLLDDDEDVRDERDRVDARHVSGVQANQLMVVDGLAKRFGSFQAVKGVSFQVSPGECFGLLGVNGAGKTTTFKMLTGALIPTAGTASISNYSLETDRTKYLSQIGYCPQFDAINGLLTARETLVMMGQLRGMAKDKAGKQANYWIDLLGLTEYADRQCGNYSGGNKRKLSIGMALMADPVVVFLDEPTSGVDPVARRKLWVVIAKIQKAGQSVLLTSHSMDECEALCNRLTIMVKGQMKCIGNIQYLKQRFAQGYTVMLKFHQGVDRSSAQVEQLIDDFHRTFGTCEIISESFGIIQFHVKSTSHNWSILFKSLDELKNQYRIIEDYTLSETTLEEVFISFAKVK